MCFANDIWAAIRGGFHWIKDGNLFLSRRHSTPFESEWTPEYILMAMLHLIKDPEGQVGSLERSSWKLKTNLRGKSPSNQSKSWWNLWYFQRKLISKRKLKELDLRSLYKETETHTRNLSRSEKGWVYLGRSRTWCKGWDRWILVSKRLRWSKSS